MNLLQNLKENWKAGLTVSLVSIPLSVSLAVASQTSPVVGIITAVWAGLIASVFGGSNFNITGPTGALSGILAAYAITHGASSLAMLAIVAGGMILVAYAFRLERYLVFVPGSAIIGFTLGVACIIALNQLNSILGLQNLEKHPHFLENIAESLSHLPDASLPAVVVFGVALGTLFLLARLLPRIPGAIILAPMGILLGFLSVTGRIPLDIVTLGTQYPDLTGRLFIPPTFFFDRSLLITGFAVALVAIIETILSAKIADGMTRTRHDSRKEMLGLGLANIGSGLMGGIPATAALARTSLNIKSNATNKLSATISSICIGLISVLLLSYFSYIPMAVIAAILVFVAYRMVETRHIMHLWKHDRVHFSIAIGVAVITLVEDPIVGILAGTAVALLLFMEDMSRGYFEMAMNDVSTGKVRLMSGKTVSAITRDSHILVYSIKGQLVYLNAVAHVSRFEKDIKEYYGVVLRLRELYFIDTDGITALEEIIDLIRAQGKPVFLTGLSSQVSQKLRHEMRYFAELEKSGVILPKTTEALEQLGFSVH